MSFGYPILSYHINIKNDEYRRVSPNINLTYLQRRRGVSGIRLFESPGFRGQSKIFNLVRLTETYKCLVLPRLIRSNLACHRH